jgi:hypothetical protein
MKRKNFPNRKETRRQAAQLRQESRAKRTDKQQIVLCRKRRGESNKEITRLSKKLNKNK